MVFAVDGDEYRGGILDSSDVFRDCGSEGSSFRSDIKLDRFAGAGVEAVGTGGAAKGLLPAPPIGTELGRVDSGCG